MTSNCVIAYLTAEMFIPEIPGFFRGGLGDLAGHTVGGLGKRYNAIPITYGYPRHWQTGELIDYRKMPGLRYLFDLDVDVYFPPVRFSVPIFGIDRCGTGAYLICPQASSLSNSQGDILYPSDTKINMEQSAFFGRAAEALLMRLGIKPDIVWCQEWRAGMTSIPSITINPYFEGTKHLYTSHTSRPEALPKFPSDWFDGLSINRRFYKDFLHEGYINPDKGCIRLADMVNGVSKEHGEILRTNNPEEAHKMAGIMNAVDRNFALSNRVKSLSNPTPLDLFVAHQGDKRDLVDLVNSKTNTNWTADDFVIGLIRRIAWYKNQHPMFKDIVHNLVRAGAKILIGGVAHENDYVCRPWAEEFKGWMKNPQLNGNFIYIPEYNGSLRRLAAQGCDVWVECPWPQSEACGTGIFFAWINGNLVVATYSGGAKEHGTAINVEDGTGDCLYIDPYEPAVLEAQLRLMHGWYNNWIKNGNDLWLRLRRNAFKGGERLTIENMLQRYEERCFKPLLASREKMSIAV